MGTPDNRRALSRKNQQAWEHYLECSAVGDFPEDGVVRRNAGLILEAVQISDRQLQRNHTRAVEYQTEALIAMVKAMAGSQLQ